MRRLALALLLGGCAHPGPATPAAPARPRQPVALQEVEGLDGEQGSIIESALCQGLVEGNPGDVTCPDSVRTATSLLAQRHLTGEDVSAQSAELMQRVQSVPQRVRARGEQPGPGRLLLHLELVRTADGSVLDRREVEAPDLEQLLPRAQQAAAELVR